MKCKKCGTETMFASKFCFKCGSLLEEGSEQIKPMQNRGEEEKKLEKKAEIEKVAKESSEISRSGIKIINGFALKYEAWFLTGSIGIMSVAMLIWAFSVAK